MVILLNSKQEERLAARPEYKKYLKTPVCFPDKVVLDELNHIRERMKNFSANNGLNADETAIFENDIGRNTFLPKDHVRRATSYRTFIYRRCREYTSSSINNRRSFLYGLKSCSYERVKSFREIERRTGPRSNGMHEFFFEIIDLNSESASMS